MCNQGIKAAAGEVMSATLGTPAGHAFPPDNVVELARRITHRLHSKETLDILCVRLKTSGYQNTNSIQHL